MKLELPNFASEAEEADWWYDHRDELDDYMEAVVKDGKAISMQDFLREHNLLVATESATFDVLSTDAERARRFAAEKGMQYEEYLASLIHSALAAKEAA